MLLTALAQAPSILGGYRRDMSSNRKRSARGDSASWVTGILVGIAIGISLGIAMGNIGAGIAIGTGIGVAFGVAFSQSKRSQQQHESDRDSVG